MTRVLYVEANEDGTVGGSHKIQADLVTRVSSQIEPVMLYYQDNVWADRMREAGLEVHVWDDVRALEREGLGRGRARTAVTLLKSIVTRRRFLREHRIDIVHLNNSPYRGHDDWLPACKSAGIPCTVYAMGDAFFVANRIRRSLLTRFDLFFPLSKLVADALVANGVRAQRMVLTYPGLDIEEIHSRSYRDRAEVLGEFALPTDCVLAVMVGNLREWKGQHVVLESLSQLDPEARSRIRLLFVGEAGPEHSDYENRVTGMLAELDLEGVATFVGHRDDVPDLLEAADIAVHASIIPEPFGLVVLEAMVHGCAVVAADAGGPVEMLTTECGYLFDPASPSALASHLEVLISQESKRAGMGREARERARDFDIEHHVQLVEEAYERVL